MAHVHAEIVLTNMGDMARARMGIKSYDNVRRLSVTMRVDISHNMLAINEKIQAALGFPVLEKRKFRKKTGEIEEYEIVSPVEVNFKNRSTICDAIVLPGGEEPVLGLIPFLGMDMAIDQEKKELAVNPSSLNAKMIRLPSLKLIYK